MQDKDAHESKDGRGFEPSRDICSLRPSRRAGRRGRRGEMSEEGYEYFHNGCTGPGSPNASRRTRHLSRHLVRCNGANHRSDGISLLWCFPAFSAPAPRHPQQSGLPRCNHHPDLAHPHTLSTTMVELSGTPALPCIHLLIPLPFAMHIPEF